MSRSWRAYAAAFAATFFTVAASAATLTLGDASLSGDQLTVPVTVSGAAAGDLKLYIGEAGPKDGEPTATASAATLAIAEDGSYNLTAQISVGAKIAYKAVLGTDESASGSITATDTSEYIWVNNATGLWSNPDNWTRKNTATDNYKNIGYPAYSTGIIRFNGNQTAEVTLDADYGRFGDLKIDNQNLKLTIKGNGYSLSTGNTACADNNEIVLDNVKADFDGSYHVKNNAFLKMRNEATLKLRWEMAVEGANALLYVGPNCELNADNWERVSLDGTGAKIVIDDGYIHCFYFRIGHYKAETPYGIVFQGTNPRLRPKFGLTIENYEIGTGSVLEFFVPRGGFQSTPVYLIEGGNGPFLGTWASTSRVQMKVAPNSPFFQDLDTADVCLVDWARGSHAINGDLITFAAFENPDADSLYYSYRDSDDESTKNKLWAHLTGTGAAQNTSAIDPLISVSSSASTAQLTATGTVTGLGDGTTVAVLYIDEVEPNGTVRTVRAAEQVVSEVGEVTLTGTVTLGVEARSSIVLENTQGESVYRSFSSTNTAAFANNLTFKWKANASGLWSDPDNWEIEGTPPTDGLSRLNYPTRGCKARFYGSQTDVIQVDGDYAGLSEIQAGWDYADLTFVGTVEGAAMRTSGFKDMGTTNVKLTLDGVLLEGTSVHIVNNSSLTMRRGAKIWMLFEVALHGQNAYLYVGTNCVVDASMKGGESHRLELSGKDAEIVVDDGCINALYLVIGQSQTTDLPKGISFTGKNPRLELRNSSYNDRRSCVCNAIPGSPVFRFVIPEEGYTSTPVVRTGDGSNTLFARDSEAIPQVVFAVDKASPYLAVRGKFTQKLVDWTRGSTEYAIDTAGVTLAEMPGSKKSRIYFTPETGETKSGIAAFCYGKDGFAVVVR